MKSAKKRRNRWRMPPAKEPSAVLSGTAHIPPLQCSGRVRALAEERNIPAADIHKLMYKRPSTPDVMVFCEKDDVNFDWLLCGDLKGLQCMMHERKLRGAAQTPIVDRIIQKCRNLSPELQKIVEAAIDRLLVARK